MLFEVAVAMFLLRYFNMLPYAILSAISFLAAIFILPSMLCLVMFSHMFELRYLCPLNSIFYAVLYFRALLVWHAVWDCFCFYLSWRLG